MDGGSRDRPALQNLALAHKGAEERAFDLRKERASYEPVFEGGRMSLNNGSRAALENLAGVDK